MLGQQRPSMTFSLQGGARRKKHYHAKRDTIGVFFRGEWFRRRVVGWREGNSLQEQLAFGAVVLTAAKTVFYLGCAAFILSK